MEKSAYEEEEERAYWRRKRLAYIEMSERLLNEPGYEWRDPLAFCRDIFPEGFLQEKWGDGERCEFDGKPNAIALKFGPRTKKAKVKGGEVDVPRVSRFTVTDDLDVVSDLVRESIADNAPVYMAPVSWYGKKNVGGNARFLHAFAVDLDGVTPGKLGTVLKQMRNGHDPSLPKGVSMPQATYIVMSGRGLHLYYLLDRPVPLTKRNVTFLQELKRRLTDVVWTDYTSEDGNKGRQYQGIYQGFRMPGTTTRLNGKYKDSKDVRKYEALAFAYMPRGACDVTRVSLDYLIDYCGIRGKEIPGKIRRLQATAGRTPLAEAREKWPEWYERRIDGGADWIGYTTNQAAYRSWLERIAVEAVVHGRYFAILTLVAYAVKCDVPYEVVERDAYALVDRFNDLSDEPGNPFTEYDVECALSSYGNKELKRWKNEHMCRRAMMEPHMNIRHGLSRKDNLEIARTRRDQYQRNKGTHWWDNGGRPAGARNKTYKKRDAILEYAAVHPEASQRAIAKALGVSPTTVNKWLKSRSE